MRFIRTLLPAALLVTLAACGGAATSSAPASQASASSAASSSASAEASASASEGSGSADLDRLEDELTPPDSSETSRSDVPGGTVISYETSASMDDLRSFYLDKFEELGLEILTSDAGDSGVSWVFGESSEAFGGSVVLAPSGGTVNVIVTLAEGG